VSLVSGDQRRRAGSSSTLEAFCMMRYTNPDLLYLLYFNDAMGVTQIGEAFGWGAVTCDQLGQRDSDVDVFEPVRIDVRGR